MKNSITTKLWLIIVLTVILSLLVVGISLNSLLEDFYFDQQAKTLIHHGERINKLLSESPDSQTLDSQLRLISRFIESHVMIFDKQGLQVSCASMMPAYTSMHLTDSEIKEIARGNTIVSRGELRNFDGAMLRVVMPVTDGDRVEGAVMLLKPVAPITETVARMRELIIFTAVGAVFLATIIGFLVSGKIAGPLVVMNRVARKMAEGDFSHRVPVETSDEVGQLAESFNLLSAELKNHIEALSGEKDRLANIVGSINDGIITLNNQGKVILANQQAEKLLGLELKPGKKLIGDSTKDPTGKKLQAALRKRFGETEIELGKKVLSLRTAPLKGQDEGPGGVVIVVQDITIKKKSEDLRREFLASVSHELRTPLGLLQGYVEALMDGMAEDKKDLENFLMIIDDETRRLKRLVDELMDLNQLETGHLKLNKRPLDILDLVNNVEIKFRQAAQQQGVALKVESPNTNLPQVRGDGDRIQQVLINLVSNALQHTPPGGEIIIRVHPEENELLVEVTDTGEGIDPEELPFVWERFYKIDKSRTRGKGGTGLGLAIVKRLVEAHGGNVGVRSTPGKGSTFFFTLPALSA